MNITKTELPTRPHVVKKFKLECDGKEYIVTHKQFEYIIETSGDDGSYSWLEVKLRHGVDLPTHEELINKWHKWNNGDPKERVLIYSEEFKIKPTLLQWIKNLFKKKL